MKIKVLLVLCILSLISFLPITSNNTVSANEEIIRPMWVNIDISEVKLYSNGNSLYLESKVRATNLNNGINATIFLEKYSNGRWVNESSWTISAKGNLINSKSYYGTKGTRYRARLRATVNGETSTAISSSIQL